MQQQSSDTINSTTVAHWSLVSLKVNDHAFTDHRVYTPGA